MINAILEGDDEDKLVVVPEAESDSGTAATDEPKVVIEGEEEDEDRAALDGNDEQREARRRERQERKDRQRQARERNKNYTEQLEKTIVNLHDRLQNLEGRQVEDGFNRLDRAISGASNAVQAAKQEIESSTQAGDSGRLARAQEVLIEAKMDLKTLQDHREKVTEEFRNKPRETQNEDRREVKPDAPKTEVGADPHVVNNFKTFLRRNPWYKPDASDPTSRAVQQIDAQIAAEGYDPRGKDYWEELEDRVQMSGIVKPTSSSRPPATDRTRDGAPPRSNEVVLSKERVTALKEAGLWDDPQVRNKMVKRYASYDKQQRSA